MDELEHIACRGSRKLLFGGAKSMVLDLLGFSYQRHDPPPAIILFRRYDVGFLPNDLLEWRDFAPACPG